MPLPALLFWTAASFVFGAVTGSFLNVCVWRLATERSLIWPNSTCPACLSPIRWYDNIPVLARLLWLRNGCRDCGSPIAITYALGEAACGAMFAGLFLAYYELGLRDGLHVPGLAMAETFAATAPVLVLHWYLLASLVVASLVDLRLKLIPAGVTDLGIAVGLLGSVVVPVLHPPMQDGPDSCVGTGPTGVAAGWGAAVGWVALWGLGKAGLWARLRGEDTTLDPPVRQPPDAEFAADEAEMSDDDFARWQSEVRRLSLVELLQCALPIGAAVLAVQWWPVGADGLPAVPAAEWFRGAGASLLGITAGAMVIWVLRAVASLGFGKEAMGSGDVYLMAMAGAFLGWQVAVPALLFAPFPALAYIAVAVMFPGTIRNRKLPFGPWLALGVVVVMLAHEPVCRQLLEPFAFLFRRLDSGEPL